MNTDKIIEILSDNNIKEIDKLYQFFYKSWSRDDKTRTFDILSQKDNLNSSENWMLGWLYFNHVETLNVDKALYYFNLSANQCNTMVLYSLGILHINGLVVDRDYVKAKEYFELGADQGNSQAQNALGRWYSTGTCVNQNKQKAKEYYTLSADQGNSEAMQSLEILLFEETGIVNIYLENEKFKRENKNLKKQIENLQTENKELILEIDYRPGGKGYYYAEEDFNQSRDKQKN